MLYPFEPAQFEEFAEGAAGSMRKVPTDVNDKLILYRRHEDCSIEWAWCGGLFHFLGNLMLVDT